MYFPTLLDIIGLLLLFSSMIKQANGCYGRSKLNASCCWDEQFTDRYLGPMTIQHCPRLPDPWCNAFGWKCLVCLFTLSPDDCSVVPHCSCFFCCSALEEVRGYCPFGCKDCVYDGEGGCDGHNKYGNAMGRAMMLLEETGNFNHTKSGAKEAFEKVDTDQDGKLSLEESVAFLVADERTKGAKSREEWHADLKWFKKMDENGNGHIEPGEFDHTL